MYFLLLYDLIRKKKTKYNTDVNIRHPFFPLCFIRFGCLWWRKYENECLIDCFFILFKCHSYHLNVSSTIRCEMVMFNYKWKMTKYNIFVLFFVASMFFLYFFAKRFNVLFHVFITNVVGCSNICILFSSWLFSCFIHLLFGPYGLPSRGLPPLAHSSLIYNSS